LGAKVVTISGPDGYIYDPNGISGEKIDYMLELRSSGNDIVAPYADEFPGSTFIAGKRPWEVKADIALPCATQNELNGDDARQLIENKVMCVGEISNMGCTPEAIDLFIEHVGMPIKKVLPYTFTGRTAQTTNTNTTKQSFPLNKYQNYYLCTRKIIK